MAEEYTPRKRLTLDHIGVLAAALIVAVTGWVGMACLVINTLPRAFPYWLFFVCLFMATTGTALPFVRFLNIRFSRRGAPPVPGGVLLRQSIWVGLFITACAWLRIPRVLNGAIAFCLALSLVVIELFLRLRERAQYRL
jgi:hypothetical protein